MQIQINPKQFYFELSIWSLSVDPAFMHHKIYSSDDKKERQNFKVYMRKEVIEMVKKYKVKKCSEEEHLKNISKLSKLSKSYSKILNNGALSFGISQKILNLFLKQMWCAGKLKNEPPHFPIDRIIINKLNAGNISWSKMKNDIEYLKVIKKAKSHPQFRGSLAKLELELYNDFLGK